MTKAFKVVGLKPSEKLLLLGIANHDGDGGAWPSEKATLAMYVGIKERQIRYLIAALVEKGLVTVRVNKGGNADTRTDRRPNSYVSNLANFDRDFNGWQSTAPRTTEVENGERGAVQERTGGSAVPERVAVDCHLTVLEPSSNRPSFPAVDSCESPADSVEAMVASFLAMAAGEVRQARQPDESDALMAGKFLEAAIAVGCDRKAAKNAVWHEWLDSGRCGWVGMAQRLGADVGDPPTALFAVPEAATEPAPTKPPTNTEIAREESSVITTEYLAWVREQQGGIAPAATDTLP